jgi:hypothetical protein
VIAFHELEWLPRDGDSPWPYSSAWELAVIERPECWMAIWRQGERYCAGVYAGHPPSAVDRWLSHPSSDIDNALFIACALQEFQRGKWDNPGG